MSIDLIVLPCVKGTARWSDIWHQWVQTLGPFRDCLGERPALCRLGSETPIAEQETLQIDGYYHFVLAAPSTLSLGVESNAGNYDEQGVVEDFGRNLSPEAIAGTVDCWRSAGFCYSLTTMGGRGEHEPGLFVALAAAVAETCRGHVIVMNDVFDLSIGVYSAQEFSRAAPRF